jgi:hypothetical protein
MIDIHTAVKMILAGRRRVPAGESMLVAVSGIDGSGKGYVTERIVACLQREGVHTVVVNVDGWLNLPSRRFHEKQPAEHFYRHAIRFDDMFHQLILPLKRQRSIWVEALLTEETATSCHRHVYDLRDVDVIVLEGIYLLNAPSGATTTWRCGSSVPSKPLWSEHSAERRKACPPMTPSGRTRRSTFRPSTSTSRLTSRGRLLTPY